MTLTFVAALSAVFEEEVRIAREGWNGKNMFVFLVKGWTYTDGKNDNYENLPFVALKTADNKVVPWNASQTDMAAKDWVIIL